MSEIKELSNLPEELKLWGERALGDIESPEKRHEAARELRDRIDNLWKACSSENAQERVGYILESLGDADVAAREMKKTYALKPTPKTDIKVGIIFLILSALYGIYAYMAFFVFPNETSTASPYATYLTGRGAGCGAVAAIVLFVLGVLILLNARKRRTVE